jgi:hypothetical protein
MIDNKALRPRFTDSLGQVLMMLTTSVATKENSYKAIWHFLFLVET